MKPPRGLFHKIIRRLGLEKSLKITKEKLAFSFIGLLLAGTAFVFAANFLHHELMESEFGPIISLSVSDTRIVLLRASDFILAFLESIPVVYVTAVLSAVLLLLIGLKLVFQYAGRASLIIKSINKK